MSKNRLFLIDANAFCYRAYYAIRNLSTSYGQPTNAVYGFISMLKKILKRYEPEFLGICFDVKGTTFRQKKFTDYKINRQPMPDGLTSQMPLIKQVISSYNLAIFEMEGFEADDIIATITKKMSQKTTDIFIVSGDKDILQLVDDRVWVYNHLKEDIIYDTEKVEQAFGVAPDKIADLLALTGDKTDNIPGVKGIGEVTAKKLLKEFGSLENIFSHLEKIESQELRSLLKQQKEQAFLSKELAVLNTEVPLKLDLDKFKIGQPDNHRLFKLFKELEFKSLLQELPLKEDGPKIKLEVLETQAEISHFLKDLSQKEAFAFVFQSYEGKEDKVDSLFIPLEKTTDFNRWCTDSQADGGLRPPSAQTVRGRNSLTGFICLKDLEVIKIPLPNLGKIVSLFQDEKILKIGYNLKQIMVYFLKQKKELKLPLFDLMLAAYLIDPAKTNYALEDLAWEYLEEQVKSDTLEEAKIVSLIFRLKPLLEEQLKQRSLWELFVNVEIPLSLVLARMEFEGVAIDKSVLNKLSDNLGRRIKELISKIYSLAGHEFNINSPKQLSSVLFEELKLPVVKKTKTGTSTDEEVLSKLADSHKIAADLLEYRQLVKLKSTYTDSLLEIINPQTNRLHTSFNQTSTETGRLSSSNPNLQNIPVKTEIGRQIRKAFIPSREDNFFVSADYSQIELRILAHLSSDENLIRAFKQGQDIHRFTASLLFNQKLREISQEMRDIAKRVNFGIIYGISAYGLAKDLNTTQEEAQEFIDAYFLRYPKVKEFMELQIKKAKNDGFVTTLLGRRRYIPQINSPNMNLRQFAERQAINMPVQGSASDLIKLAMINIQKELCKRNLKSRLTIQVHDELVFDCPQKEWDLLKGLVRDSMENVLRLSVPIKVSIKYGKNWLEQKEVE